YARRRISGCNLLLWWCLEMDQCTTFCLILLVLNRVWCQRNYDHYHSDIEAMRYPIVLIVSTALLGMWQPSTYVSALIKDAKRYNLTLCSFSFVHHYGSPGLEEPTVKNIKAIEEIGLFLCVLFLLVAIIRQSPNMNGGKKEQVFAEPSEAGLSEISSGLLRSRVKALNAMRRSQSKVNERVMTPSSCAERDRDLSLLTAKYATVYFLMGAPSRIADYILRYDSNPFPLLMMLSLLRQAFQAGTLLFMYVGSSTIRETVTALCAQSPTLQYTSGATVYEQNMGKRSWIPRKDRPTNVAESPLLAPSDRSHLPLHTEDQRSQRGSSRLDRLELGLTMKEPATRKSLVNLSKRSTTAGFHQRDNPK
ncbi:hypothetical protein PoB_000579900, partial [Plakobranchus ocellatus]